MTEDELIKNLQKLSRWLFRPRVQQSFVREIAAPATPEQLASTEQALGFGLPPLLRRLYAEVGNGGYGPGYGLMGCLGGYRDARRETIVEGYLGRREPDPEDRNWQWPEGLVPLISWGGAIYFCGDFKVKECPIHEFDPVRYRGKAPLASALQPQSLNLQDLFSRWIAGEKVRSDLGE